MTHIEEHILELYVLDSKKIEHRRAEIETHLNECVGCKALANEMTSFYKDARADLNALQESEAPTQKALVRTSRGVAQFGERFSAPMPFAHTTPMGRLRYFVYKHPFVAASGTFAFGAAAVMALSLLTPTRIKETNPAYKNYNVSQGRVEILNRNHEKLWELPSQSLQEAVDAETRYDTRRTIVADLDGDGKNEVLTTLQVGAESTPPTCFKVFDAKPQLKFQKCFNEDFSYLGRTYYGPQFNTDVFVLNDLDPGKREIFLIATNYGRSPCFVARLDNQCNEIGKYWHFGNLGTILLFDIDKNGKKELILGGTDDARDSTHGEFPMIVVLDPTKIIGDKKATSAPGFGFPYSDTEVYCIQLPLSDMNIALKANAAVQRIDTSRNAALSFVLHSGRTEKYPESEEIQFEYFFARDMSVIEVTSGNATDRIHDLMVQQGRLTGKMDKLYLENLKNDVRYWDGKEWRREVVKVKHNSTLTIAK